MEWQNVAAGVAAFMGGLVIVFKRLGRDGVSKCPDPDCQKTVVVIEEKLGHVEATVHELKHAQEEQRRTLEGMASDLAFIRGRLVGGKE